MDNLNNKKILSNIIDNVNQSVSAQSTNYQPSFINNGNLFSTYTQLKAFSSQSTGELSKWLLYTFWKKNDSNLFICNNTDPYIKKLFTNLVNMKIDYGYAGVMKLNDNWVPALILPEISATSNGWKGEAVPFSNDYSYILNAFPIMESSKKVKVNETNCAILKDNEFNLPAYYYVEPYLNDFLTGYFAIRTNLQMKGKKYEYIVRNNQSDRIIDELTSFFNPKNALLLTVANDVSSMGVDLNLNLSSESNNVAVSNSFRKIDVDANDKDGIEAFSLFLEKVWNPMLAIPNPLDDKRERRVSAEVESATQKSNIIIQDKIKYMEIFIDDCSQLGLELDVENFIDTEETPLKDEGDSDDDNEPTD